MSTLGLENRVEGALKQAITVKYGLSESRSIGLHTWTTHGDADKEILELDLIFPPTSFFSGG